MIELGFIFQSPVDEKKLNDFLKEKGYEKHAENQWFYRDENSLRGVYIRYHLNDSAHGHGNVATYFGRNDYDGQIQHDTLYGILDDFDAKYYTVR